MLAINTAAMNFYTTMMNNSAYSMMMGANSQLGMMNYVGNTIANGGNVNFKALAEADTRNSLQMIQDSLNYKISKAMLENLKKKQKEDTKSLNYFA